MAASKKKTPSSRIVHAAKVGAGGAAKARKRPLAASRRTVAVKKATAIRQQKPLVVAMIYIFALLSVTFLVTAYSSYM
jgi:hypothetical protein